MKDICFGIRIQTCQRPKPLPIKAYVTEAIECVKKQTYTNWKVFLIGDCYEPRSELKELAKLLPPEKVVVANLPRAIEREVHKGYDLWCSGGVTAFNFCLDLMNELDIEICANYDDDDIWFPNHLASLHQGYQIEPTPIFVCTHGHYKIQNYILPLKNKPNPDGTNGVGSIAANSCNCACSWNIQKMPLRARNCIRETPWAKNCWDYWFWRQFEEKANKDGQRMVIMPQVTVFQRHTHLTPINVGYPS